MIAVKDYAERRGVSTQAIYKQLKVHKEALDGHVLKENGKTIWSFLFSPLTNRIYFDKILSVKIM